MLPRCINPVGLGANLKTNGKDILKFLKIRD
jgi:hypothetical protein